MQRVAPKPTLLSGKEFTHFRPHQLTDQLTPVRTMFETSSMSVPNVDVSTWRLVIGGLVDTPTSLCYDDLRQLPKRTLESVFVCSGNPAKPTVALRKAANVKWGGVDLATLLDSTNIRREATHVWAYGLDFGNFHRTEEQHYVKDMPLSRLREGDVLIVYELNDEPLSQQNGFPARLVIPGYYGTNSVKWLCRLQLSDLRAQGTMTTKFYNDPDLAADPSGKVTKPVWAVAPESLIVSPAPKAQIACAACELWGWTWSSCAVGSVQVSTDGGDSWIEASLNRAADFRGNAFLMSGRHPAPDNIFCNVVRQMKMARPSLLLELVTPFILWA